MGVRRVRWAGAALHRPARNTEVPHPPAAGGRGPAAPTSLATWPSSASPHLVTPRAFALAARPRASPRHVPQLCAEEPAAARSVQTLCVRATACVRGPESRARPRASQPRARRGCPASSSSAAGRGPVVRPGDGEHGTWLLVLKSDLLSLSPSPQASRGRVLRRPRLVQSGFFLNSPIPVLLQARKLRLPRHWAGGWRARAALCHSWITQTE